MRGYKKPTVHRRVMEDSEVDDWFNEQKEKLEEKFYASKDQVKAKEEFDVAYRKLILGLQQKQEAIYEHKMRMAAMQAPIGRIRDKTKLFFASIGVWFTLKKQAVKKWFFDQKIKRILKDKSDL
jgi:hypothetical protein